MSIGRASVSRIHPWWVRLLFLGLVGVPPLTGWPIRGLLNVDDPFRGLAAWGLYASFVWLLVWLSGGMETLLTFLCAASLVGLPVAAFGSLVRHIPYFATVNGKELTETEIGLMMTGQLLVILSVVPYALLCVGSFSAADLARRLSAQSPGRLRSWLIHLALALRVVQHAMESVTQLFEAWREENPDVIIPRFRESWREGTFGFLGVGPWFKQTAMTWGVGLLVHALEPVPVLVDEMRSLSGEQESD